MSYSPKHWPGTILINEDGYILKITGVDLGGRYLTSSWIRQTRRWGSPGYRDADWVDRKFKPYRLGDRLLWV